MIPPKTFFSFSINSFSEEQKCFSEEGNHRYPFTSASNPNYMTFLKIFLIFFAICYAI